MKLHVVVFHLHTENQTFSNIKKKTAKSSNFPSPLSLFSLWLHKSEDRGSWFRPSLIIIHKKNNNGRHQSGCIVHSISKTDGLKSEAKTEMDKTCIFPPHVHPRGDPCACKKTSGCIEVCGGNGPHLLCSVKHIPDDFMGSFTSLRSYRILH